jgi:UDP-N-acetylglucosamine acyltransferase
VPDIHPTAIIGDGTRLADDVTVGAFSVIGPAVTVGPGTVIDHHVSLTGNTVLGSRNRLFPFASVGSIPQDLKYRGENTRLLIGDDNIFREFVTVNLGTAGGGGETVIGNGNLLMAYVHVAHDCRIGNRVIMANCATLAGHIEVHDHAVLGGLSAVHQFVRIGRHAMVGGATGVVMDIPPGTIASGNRAELHGLNLIGLKRRGFGDEEISGLKKAYRIIFRSGLTIQEALDTVAREITGFPEVDHLVEFIRSSKRGVTR